MSILLYLITSKLIIYQSNHFYFYININLQLDTISRILTDRQWTVGNLATASLKFSVRLIEERHEGRNSLFEELIGVDKPSP